MPNLLLFNGMLLTENPCVSVSCSQVAHALHSAQLGRQFERNGKTGLKKKTVWLLYLDRQSRKKPRTT